MRHRPVTIYLDGIGVMTCLTLAEAQYRTGYSTTTIRRFAVNGKTTVLGFSFELKGDGYGKD